jgi:hypothetical protein
MNANSASGWIDSLNTLFNGHKISFKLTDTNIVEDKAISGEFHLDKNPLKWSQSNDPRVLQLVVMSNFLNHRKITLGKQIFHGIHAHNLTGFGLRQSTCPHIKVTLHY